MIHPLLVIIYLRDSVNHNLNLNSHYAIGHPSSSTSKARILNIFCPLANEQVEEHIKGAS